MPKKLASFCGSVKIIWNICRFYSFCPSKNTCTLQKEPFDQYLLGESLSIISARSDVHRFPSFHRAGYYIAMQLAGRTEDPAGDGNRLPSFFRITFLPCRFYAHDFPPPLLGFSLLNPLQTYANFWLRAETPFLPHLHHLTILFSVSSRCYFFACETVKLCSVNLFSYRCLVSLRQ